MGCSGERLVVQLCAAGRAFTQVLLDQAEQAPLPPEWAYGCIPARRREAAMLAQKVVSWRCSQAGWMSATIFHDATNGFFSLKQDKVAADAWPPYVNGIKQHEILRDRIMGATVTLVDDDFKEEMAIGQGVLPGDHGGPRLFNNTYNRALVRAGENYKRKSKYATPLTCNTPIGILNSGPGAHGA